MSSKLIQILHKNENKFCLRFYLTVNLKHFSFLDTSWLNEQYIVTLKNIFAHVSYNCTSIENRNSVKDYSNYGRMIKKNHENHKFISLG